MYGSDENISTDILYPGQNDRESEQLPQGHPVPLHMAFNASFINLSVKNKKSKTYGTITRNRRYMRIIA